MVSKKVEVYTVQVTNEKHTPCQLASAPAVPRGAKEIEAYISLLYLLAYKTYLYPSTQSLNIPGFRLNGGAVSPRSRSVICIASPFHDRASR